MWCRSSSISSTLCFDVFFSFSVLSLEVEGSFFERETICSSWISDGFDNLIFTQVGLVVALIILV